MRFLFAGWVIGGWRGVHQLARKHYMALMQAIHHAHKLALQLRGVCSKQEDMDNRILRRFLRMGHSPLITYIQSVLNRVSERDDFSDRLKQGASRLQELLQEMNAIHCSGVPHKGELTVAARKKVEEEMRMLLGTLESETRRLKLEPAEAQLLIHSLGLKTRATRGPLTPRQLLALAGPEKGSVRLRTRGQALMYEWWYSADTIHFSNPIQLPYTVVARTEVKGLDRGIYAFFCRTYRRNEPPLVEGPVKFGVIEKAG
jgi:hypothetical protein